MSTTPTTEPDPWRIVLDTASFISGVRSPHGAARELLLLILRDELRIVMDLKLSLEYRDVAQRPQHLKATTGSIVEVETFLRDIEATAEPALEVASLRPFSTDPNDDMIIELAVAMRVDAIVTSNVRHFARVSETFGILVLTPGELLVRLRERR